MTWLHWNNFHSYTVYNDAHHLQIIVIYLNCITQIPCSQNGPLEPLKVFDRSFAYANVSSTVRFHVVFISLANPENILLEQTIQHWQLAAYLKPKNSVLTRIQEQSSGLWMRKHAANAFCWKKKTFIEGRQLYKIAGWANDTCACNLSIYCICMRFNSYFLHMHINSKALHGVW